MTSEVTGSWSDDVMSSRCVARGRSGEEWWATSGGKSSVSASVCVSVSAASSGLTRRRCLDESESSSSSAVDE